MPAPVPAPDVTATATPARDATTAPATATPAVDATPPAAAAVAKVVATTLPEPPVPRPVPGQGVEAGGARVVAVGAARSIESLARALPAITLPSHRNASDVAMLALNPLAFGAQTTGRSDSHPHYSADVGAGAAEQPATDGPAHSVTAITLGIALSIGVIGWASRGAALMASVLVASPAWGSYDLLPVLRRRTEDADWGDDESPDDAPLDETDLTPLDASAGTTRRDHDILELH